MDGVTWSLRLLHNAVNFISLAILEPHAQDDMAGDVEVGRGVYKARNLGLEWISTRLQDCYAYLNRGSPLRNWGAAENLRQETSTRNYLNLFFLHPSNKTWNLIRARMIFLVWSSLYFSTSQYIILSHSVTNKVSLNGLDHQLFVPFSESTFSKWVITCLKA